MLGALAVACGGGAAGPRGWAEPVQNDETTIISTGRGRIDGIENNIRVWRFPNFWQIENGDARRLSGIYGAPVVSSDDDTVFVADYNGFIYAFKQSQAPTPSQAAQDGFPKPLAATFNLGEPVIGGIAVDSAGNRLFATSGPRLVRLRYESDRLTADWTYRTGDDIWGVPVLASGGRVLISSLDGTLYALNQDTGAVTWEYTSGDGGLVTTPLVVGDTVYVGGFDSRIHAVNLTTGEGRWTFRASHWVWSTPIAQGSNLIFGDFNGTVYAIAASDGSEVWSVELGRGAIVGAPAITDGTIVVGTQDGWLVGLNASTREVTWQVDIGTRMTADLVVASDGNVLIAPNGCVTPEGLENRVYYYSVNPRTGELRQAQDVC